MTYTLGGLKPFLGTVYGKYTKINKCVGGQKCVGWQFFDLKNEISGSSLVRYMIENHVYGHLKKNYFSTFKLPPR